MRRAADNPCSGPRQPSAASHGLRRTTPAPRAACALLVALTLAVSAASAARPNVVLFLADDLGYGDLGCYGGKIPTPHLDGLATAGMRFTDAHSASSVCTPTRYALLTGRYNWRSGLKQGVLGGLSPHLIAAQRLTLGSMLQSAGYHTACLGKWHLGMDWSVRPGRRVSRWGIESREQVFNVDYGQPILHGPTARGFDEFFGISASLDMVPYTFIEQNRVTSLPTEDRQFPMMWGREGGGATRKGPAAPDFDAAHVLPTLAARATAYIARRAADARAGQPFFLYLAFASPHTPILPAPEWRGTSGINAYADFVMQTDEAVGAVLRALDAAQLSRETLVLFTSDNGCSPQAQLAELAAHGHDPSGSLRGHKADLFEGGHRVPLIARWPGTVAAGAHTAQLVCQTDLLATLAELLGIPLPDDAAEDSFSFLATLRSAGASPRQHLVSHSINGSFAIRQGPWKLLLCADSGGWSAPRPGSPAAAGLPPVQLYHLEDDLAEQHNVSSQQPEQVEQLRALLSQLVAQGRSTPGAPQENDAP